MSDEPTGEDASLASHIRDLLDQRLNRLAACRRFATKSDPAAALHDLRVASRRLRAFGDVFRGRIGEKIRTRADAPLKRVLRAASAVRDLDVQIGLVDAQLPGCATDAEHATLECLLEHFDRERIQATTETEKRLGKIDFGALASAIRMAREEAIAGLPTSGPKTRAFTLRLLEHLVFDAERHAPSDDGAEHPEAMHRLRVALKKLRYALELFEPTLGPGYESLHQRATLLQETLGSHHDLVVLGDLVEDRGRDLEERKRHALALGMKMLHDRLASALRLVAARYTQDRFDPEWWRASIRRALVDRAKNGDSSHVRDG
jgi:CHAD domain-containing protein